MNDDDFELDSDFDSGFTQQSTPLTETPELGAEAPVTPKQETQAAVVAAPAVAEPVYAKITQQQYDDLIKKAASIDRLAGNMGSMKQLLDRLQNSSSQGTGLQLSEDDFKEMIDEGFPDLAKMQVEGLNRAFSRLKLSGQAPNGASQEQVAEIIKQELGTQSEALTKTVRDQIAEQIGFDNLAEQHEDYKDVLNSPAFAKWRADNKVDERKDRSGALFGDSLNGNFVAKVLTEFKATQKQAATRQNRLAAAVQPRGAGGHASGPSDEDEFDAGFSGK